MLYNEFIEGTGCKDNAHNYQVYKELEIIYMNTDCSKAHIYDMGKKLVDNSKSPEQIEFENKINAEIQKHKDRIAEVKEWLEADQESLKYWTRYDDKEMIKHCKNAIRYWKQEIKENRTRINELKWVLA